MDKQIKEENELIKSAIAAEVTYTVNEDDDSLIDASYCDKGQNRTIVGVSDYHDGALDDLIYNMRNDVNFSIDSLLAAASDSFFNWEEAAAFIDNTTNNGERAYLLIEKHRNVPITIMEKQFDSAFSEYYGWSDEDRRTLKYLSVGETIDLTEQWKVVCINAIPPAPKEVIGLEEKPFFSKNSDSALTPAP